MSDVHARTLVPGLPVRARVGAEALTGQVALVEPAIKNGAVTFRVARADPASPLLRSNLRVDVLVITERKPLVLRVRRGPSTEGPGTREVFVLRGDTAMQTPVDISLTGFEACEVVRGLQQGDEARVARRLPERGHADVLRVPIPAVPIAGERVEGAVV